MVSLSRLSWTFASTICFLICSGCGGGGSASGGTGDITSPPAPTYVVGGTVSGLTGELTLQDNGNDVLTLNADGSFKFANSIKSGGAYAVTVSNQPENPGQFCVVNNGSGTAFSNVSNVQVTCTTPAEQILHDFGQEPAAANPTGPLVLDSNGNLYGVTTGGGSSGNGAVYRLTPSNGQWSESVLYSFCQLPLCTDGSHPVGGLTWDAAGNLYGATESGGTFLNGVAFKLSPNGNGTWTETVIHNFGDGTDGRDPRGGLTFDKSGNLYGTTFTGGTGSQGEGAGRVFELTPNQDGSWTESVIYNFGSNSSDGAEPIGGVALDAEGNLYGTTSAGGSASAGTVFQISPQGGGQWTEKVIYAFQSGVNGASPALDGSQPQAGVVLDAAGNLYGTTMYGFCPGYACNNGTVFEIARGSGGQWQEKILYGFYKGTDGSIPHAPLLIDKAGNLYGTTTEGGLEVPPDPGHGEIFALTPGPASAMWAEAPLYSFKGVPDGAYPSSGLAMDAHGNLYGVANGGTNGTGVVFEVTP